MSTFSSDVLENRAYLNRALAFNTQLPMGGKAGTQIGGSDFTIPEAVKILPSGDALVSFYAPHAKEVLVRILDTTYPLSKSENGLWEAQIPYSTPGMKAIFFAVDGTEVLNALAPIGFGYSMPINYIEFPEIDCDFYTLKKVPHGTITQEIYYSTVTDQYESCMLYLPPSYFTNETQDYPVLYLQHGHGENEKCWLYQGKVNFIMDNLLSEERAVPCIIVMNNGMVHSKMEDGCIKMNSNLLERLLIDDCIPFIENKYRVKCGKANRAMAGLSMGSMQTSIITMKHPELFNYIGIFSGFLRSLMEGNHGNNHLKALDDAKDFCSRYKLFMRTMGTDDHFREIFEADTELLLEKGLDPDHMPSHKIFYYPGDHEWQVWRKCIYDFLQLCFQ